MRQRHAARFLPCSPRTHEEALKGTALAAGIEPAFYAQANIREQGAWVSEGIDAATRRT